MNILQKQIVKDFVFRIDNKRCDKIIKTIRPYLHKSDKILDVGSGFCTVSKRLKDMGHTVTSLDVKDRSLYEQISVTLYDGVKIPFKTDSFDVVLVITVLHHIKDPEKILKEAKRVAKKIIIMEDTYESTRQKYLTFAMDSIVNMELLNHPHTNKSDKVWRNLFNRHNLIIKAVLTHNYWRFFTSTTYFLEKTN